MSFYKYLDLNPKFKDEFLKAQEVGIKTLVEKMLAIFQSDTTEMSNEELLFLREKQNYIKWKALELQYRPEWIIFLIGFILGAIIF